MSGACRESSRPDAGPAPDVSAIPAPERDAFWAFTEPCLTIPIVILTRLNIPYVAGNTLTNIYRRWVSIRTDHGRNDFWLWIPLAALALILAGLAVRNRILSREIRARTTDERALNANEAFAKVVMDNLPIGIAVNSIDPAVKFEYMNDNFPRLYRTMREALAAPDAFWDSVYEDPEFREEIRKRVLDGIASGDPAQMHWVDVPITRKGQETTYITARNIPVPGQPLMISTVRDVTERKRAEDALREREQRLSSIYGTVGDCIFHIAVEPGGEYRFASINRAFSEVTGLEPEQVVGRTVSEIIPEPSRTFVLENYRRAIEGNTVIRWEETSDYPTGRLTGEVSVAPVFDDQGRCTYLVGSVHDVTERKRAEEALKASEERFRMITEQTSDLIALTDAAGVVTYVSPASRALFLCEPDEMRGRHFMEFLDPAAIPKAGAVFQDVLARGEKARDLELAMRRKDGSIFVGELSGTKFCYGVQNGTLVVIRDITERKRAVEEIRKLSSAVKQSTEGIAICDLKGNLTFVNDAWCRMHGYKDSEELLGKSLNIFHNQDQIEREVIPFNEKVNELGAYSGEVGHIHKDGTPFSTLMTVTLLKDDQGRPYALIGIAKDITGRKQAEDVLRESDTILNKLTSWVPGMIYMFKKRPDGTFCVPFSTEAIRDIFGCSPQDVQEDFSPIAGVILPEDLGRVVSSIEHSAEHLTAWTCEYRVRIPGRPVTWLLGNSTPEKSADGSITWYGFNTDITGRKRMEEAAQTSLREKETLLREIHHRVKNNMQVISSLLNLQAGHIADEEARRMLKEGQLRIRSMALIHEKLYQARDLSKIDFAAYLQSLASFLFQFFKVDPEQVRLETDLEDVRLDINTAVPCGLLVNELVSNALKHAFPDGRRGTVWIKLRREKDGTLKLRVADDGVGLPKGFDYRSSESFGLQIAHLLIEQLEGTIAVEGKKGTAFCITFRELVYKPRT